MLLVQRVPARIASMLSVCGAVTAASVLAQTANTSRPKPNFVILFVDDMGIDQIQVPVAQRKYGYTGNNGTIRTPHIYQLASEGIVFQTWYSAFHLCSPSRAAMLTGRLPIRSGCEQGVFNAEAVGGLPANETTMAEAVKEAGFATMAIGKWHLGQRDMYLPTSHGFDSYLGIPYSQDMGLSYWFYCNGPPQRDGKPPSCDPPIHEPYQPSPIPLLANTTVVDQPAGLYTLAARYSKAATNFIQMSAAASTPFLLYFPFNHIHAPSSCGEGFCGRSPRGPIGDATEEMDSVVGEVMSTIRMEDKISTNTLVFFTSDNGAPMRPDGNLPLRGYKTQIWEGGFREPGIAWWPGKIKAGSSTERLVATYDIFPTVLRLAGVALPQDRIYDGIDISPILFAADPETASGGHECIMFYKSPSSSKGPEGAKQLNSLAAIRCGNYKVYWMIDGGSSTPLPEGLKPGILSLDSPVIFDVSKDTSEQFPIAPGSPTWERAKTAAEEARLAHINTLTRNIGQMARGANRDYALCGDPNSKTKYPKLPNCTVSPQNWSPPICLRGGNLDQCISQQSCQPGCKFINCTDGGPPFSPPPPPPPCKNCWTIRRNFNSVSSDLPNGPFKDSPGVHFLGNYSTLDGCWSACNASTTHPPCLEFVWKPWRVAKWGVRTDCYQVLSGKDVGQPQDGATTGIFSSTMQ